MPVARFVRHQVFCHALNDTLLPHGQCLGPRQRFTKSFTKTRCEVCSDICMIRSSAFAQPPLSSQPPLFSRHPPLTCDAPSQPPCYLALCIFPIPLPSQRLQLRIPPSSNLSGTTVGAAVAREDDLEVLCQLHGEPCVRQKGPGSCREEEGPKTEEQADEVGSGAESQSVPRTETSI